MKHYPIQNFISVKFGAVNSLDEYIQLFLFA